MHPHDERPYSFCPMCGGDLEPRASSRPSPSGSCACGAGSCSTSTRRWRSARSSATTAAASCWCGARSSPATASGSFPAATWTAASWCTDAAVREAREEAGLDVRLDHLINIYSYPGRAPVIIVYAASIVGGTLCGDDEGLEARFFEAARDPVGRAGVSQHPRRAAGVPGRAWSSGAELEPMATFVVAHGAWSAGWAWKKMRPRLRERGHEHLDAHLHRARRAGASRVT